MNQAATHLSQYLDRDNQTIEAYDAELWSAMSAETVRQEEHIELIASENYCSPRVLEAQRGIPRETEGGCENRSKSEEKCDLPGEMPSPRGDGLFASECVPCVVSQL